MSQNTIKPLDIILTKLDNLADMDSDGVEEFNKPLIEDDSTGNIMIDKGETSLEYFSPSDPLEETIADDDGETQVDLDEKYFSAGEGHEKEHSVESITAKQTIQQPKQENSEENSKMLYECSICQKKFKRKSAVKKHETKEHNFKRKSNKFYQCSVCSNTFNTSYYVKVHEKKEHNYIRKSVDPYPCSFCEKRFKTKSYVEVHEKKHSGLVQNKTKDIDEADIVEDLGECNRKSDVIEDVKSINEADMSSDLIEDMNETEDSSLIPCLLCQEELPGTTDEHEQHLKLEHKVKFKFSWIIEQTWEEWLKKLSKDEVLIEEDAKGNLMVDKGETSFEYFSPSDLLEETIADDDGKTQVDLDKKYISVGESIVKKQTYECTFCGKGFKTKSYAEVHEKKHSGLVQNTEQKSVTEKITIQQPKQQNSEENSNILYECSICQKSFKRKSAVKKHETKEHNFKRKSNKFYPCSVCTNAFNTRYYVKVHEKKEHNFERKSNKKYQCSLCTNAFNSRNYVKVHEKKEHNYIRESIDPYPCSFCEKRFKNKSYVEVHEKKHTGALDKPLMRPKKEQNLFDDKNIGITKNIMCSFEECEKKIATREELATHVKKHKKQKHKCSICAKGFKTKAYVSDHEKKNHDQQCPFCEKAFTIKSLVIKHLKKTHGEMIESNENKNTGAFEESENIIKVENIL